MTYDSRERSIHDGSPVELYEFTRGAEAWRYTSQTADYDLAGQIYASTPIQRSTAESTQDIERTELRVTMRRDVEVAVQFIGIPASATMLLRVRRVHRGDGEAVLVWVGRVLNARWFDAECELLCEPVATSLRRNGLRRHYGRPCPHAVYDGACRADPSLHRTPGIVTAIDGATITVTGAASVPDGNLAGGYASWTSSGGGAEQRTILDNTGDVVELMAQPYGLEVGQAVDLHDGCKRNIADCDARFANTANYGGFPNIPLRNPFDGNPTF